jgi:hypothetical protein
VAKVIGEKAAYKGGHSQPGEWPQDLRQADDNLGKAVLFWSEHTLPGKKIGIDSTDCKPYIRKKGRLYDLFAYLPHDYSWLFLIVAMVKW